jgi:hypothetical protein
VRDVTVAFDGERKVLWRPVSPALEGAFLRQLVERAVAFDAGETFRAKPEPLFLRRIAVETVAPAFVIPAAGTDVSFAGHRRKSQVSVSSFQFFLNDRVEPFACGFERTHGVAEIFPRIGFSAETLKNVFHGEALCG